MPPAARLGDPHVCPMITGVVPHVGGPILPPCCPTVLIGGMPAARVGDLALCAGGPDVTALGSMPARHVGEDFAVIVQGILLSLLIAFATMAIGVAVGAMIGSGVGALAGGVGAVPGAAIGGDIGLTVAEGLLAWMGLAFLAEYVVGRL